MLWFDLDAMERASAGWAEEEERHENNITS
jgi:hypothetical protein